MIPRSRISGTYLGAFVGSCAVAMVLSGGGCTDIVDDRPENWSVTSRPDARRDTTGDTKPGLGGEGPGDGWLGDVWVGDVRRSDTSELDSVGGNPDTDADARSTREGFPVGLGTAGRDKLEDVVVGPGESIYVAGSVADTPNRADDVSYGGGASDAVLAKYTSWGEHRWTRLIGGSEQDRAHGVAVDGQGSVYMVGAVGTGVGGSEYQGGASDGFIAKFRPDGRRSWVEVVGTKGDDVFEGAVSDGGRSVVVAGAAGAGLAGESYGGGATDGLLARFWPDGRIHWSTLVGGAGRERLEGVDRAGGMGFATGVMSAGFDGMGHGGGRFDVLVMSVDLSAGGRMRWTDRLGSPGDERAPVATVDQAGELWVVGQSSGKLPRTSQGGDGDYLVARYGAGGERKVTKLIGNRFENFARAGATFSNTLWVAGATEGYFANKTVTGQYGGFITSHGRWGRRNSDTRVITDDGREPGASSDSQIPLGLDTASDGTHYVVGSTSSTFNGVDYQGGALDGFLLQVE